MAPWPLVLPRISGFSSYLTKSSTVNSTEENPIFANSLQTDWTISKVHATPYNDNTDFSSHTSSIATTLSSIFPLTIDSSADNSLSYPRSYPPEIPPERGTSISAPPTEFDYHKIFSILSDRMNPDVALSVTRGIYNHYQYRHMHIYIPK